MLACDFGKAAQQMQKTESAGSEYIHLDVMDGHFVPNISFGAPVIKSLRRYSSQVFDVHLMISHPLRYIDDFADAGADLITFHIESDSPVEETIEKIRSKGIKVCLSLKPATPAEAVFPYLDKLDMVLVMTVEPGFGGQKFMSEMTDKIKLIKEEIDKRSLDTDIQVDGGINEETIKLAAGAGANVFVAGSAVFKATDTAAIIAELKKNAGEAYLNVYTHRS